MRRPSSGFFPNYGRIFYEPANVAQQLIFTSVRRGLGPGSSGYCTAARGAALRPGLITRLEQMSVYAHRATAPHPVLLSHRQIEVGGGRYHVVSRIREAGLDFTQRTNFLAHHLVLEPAETRLDFSPAELLLSWSGWCDRWEAEPGELPAVDARQLASSIDRIHLPCAAWQRVTGDAGWAAYPLQFTGGVCWRHRVLDEYELLALMGESLRLRAGGQPERLWGTSFTTYVGNILEGSRFEWSGWNEADRLAAGRQLGAHQLEPESLKGEPRGDAEMVRAAREGFRVTQQPTAPNLPLPAQKKITGSAVPDRNYPGKTEKSKPPAGFPVLVPILALAALFGGLAIYGGKKFLDSQRKTDTAKEISIFYGNLLKSKDLDVPKKLDNEDRQKLNLIADEFRKPNSSINKILAQVDSLAVKYPNLKDIQEAKDLIDAVSMKMQQAEKKTNLREKILVFPKKEIEIKENKLPNLAAEAESLHDQWKELSPEESFPLDDKLTGYYRRLKELDVSQGDQSPELAEKRQKLLKETKELEGIIGPTNAGRIREHFEKTSLPSVPHIGPAAAAVGPQNEPFEKVQEAILLEISPNNKSNDEFFQKVGNKTNPLFVLRGDLPKEWRAKNEDIVALWKKKKWETEKIDEYFDSEGHRKLKLKFERGENPLLLQSVGTNFLVLPPEYVLPVSFSRLPGSTPQQRLANLKKFAAERILGEGELTRSSRDRWVIQTVAIGNGKPLKWEPENLEDADLRVVSQQMRESPEVRSIQTNLSEILHLSPLDAGKELQDNPWLKTVFADEGNAPKPKEWDNVFSKFNTNTFGEINKLVGKESDKPDGMKKLRELWGEEQNNKARGIIFNGAELKENSDVAEVWKKANQRFQTLRKMTGITVTATKLESMNQNNINDNGFDKNKEQVTNALRAWRKWMQMDAELQKLPKAPKDGEALEGWMERHMMGEGQSFTIFLVREGFDPPELCVLKE